MNNLLDKIHQQNATAFTHSGKFHADDVFSAALLLYLNPEIITRKIAESERTVLYMLHLAFSGRNLE